MQAAARKRDEHVAFAYELAAVDLVLFGDTHGKACEVEVALFIHRRHLGRLAADKRAAG